MKKSGKDMKTYVITRNVFLKQLEQTLMAGDEIECDGISVIEWCGEFHRIPTLRGVIEHGWLVPKENAPDDIQTEPATVNHNMNIKLKNVELDDVETRRKVTGVDIDIDAFVAEQPDDLVFEHIKNLHWQQRTKYIEKLSRPKILERLIDHVPKKNKAKISERLEYLKTNPEAIVDAVETSYPESQVHKMDFDGMAQKHMKDLLGPSSGVAGGIPAEAPAGAEPAAGGEPAGGEPAGGDAAE